MSFYKQRSKTNASGLPYYDIYGAKLPNLDKDKLATLENYIFFETFLIPAYMNDVYSKANIDWMVRYIDVEGPYGYTDGDFDVTVKAGDVVIDAGSWIGDFAAYAVSKGATAYAFEPTTESYAILQQTAQLNGERLVPISKGLSDRDDTITLSLGDNNSISNSIVIDSHTNNAETISITSIDQFVKDRNLERVDFIKADIEGAERDMLKGARETLKKFAPKLAICTYHLPDDVGVLTHLILEANPDYKIVYLPKKLFACVVK